MIGRRTRRRARALCLRSLRIVRHHYFSLLSAGVLGVTLVAALTSGSFELQDDASSAAAEPTPSLQPTANLGPVPSGATPVTAAHTVVYYFVDSQEQLNSLYGALHRDLVDEALVDYKPLHEVTRVFMLVEDHPDEEEALELIREQSRHPPNNGTVIQFVDLR
jgi:hypothetical protein